jgi:hypothetical protein
VGRRSGLGRAHRSDPVFVLHDVTAFPTLSHVKRRYIESRAAASLLPTTTPGNRVNITALMITQLPQTCLKLRLTSRVNASFQPNTEAYESFRPSNN